MTLQGAVLGLLALMIAFTFAMALSRFEGRRDAVLNEANAIGTTALRARLLPEPHGTETLNLLREYVQVRLDITQRVPTPEEFSAALSRSSEIHEALWQQAKAMAAKDSGIVPTGLFIQSLNELIDDQEKRLTALRNRVPNVVLLALYGVAAVAGAFSGYAGGLSETVLAAANVRDDFPDRRRDTLDSRSRSAEYGLHNNQPTADDRYRCRHRKILSGSVLMITTSTVIIDTGICYSHLRRLRTLRTGPRCASLR